MQKHTDKLFNVVEELERDLEELNGPSGRLSIAASEYYCSHYLSILVNAYINLHPQVKLKLIPSNSLDVIEKILSNEADIGIIACECNHKDIESHVLGEERAVLVVAAEIFKDNTKEKILEKYPFLAFHGNCSFDTLIKQCFLRWIIDRHLSSNSVEVMKPLDVLYLIKQGLLYSEKMSLKKNLPTDYLFLYIIVLKRLKHL